MNDKADGTATRRNASGTLSLLREQGFSLGLLLGLAAAQLTVIGLAVALFLYAHPTCDDDWRAARVQQLGLSQVALQEYARWTGRWAGSGLSFWEASVLDARHHYPMVLAFNACVLVLSAYCFISTLFQTGRVLTLILTSSLICIYWVGMPRPAETVYWLSGSLENELAVASVALIVALLVRQPARSSVLSLFGLAGTCLLIVIATGLHELYSLLLCFFLSIGCVTAFLLKYPTRYRWALAALVAAAGLAFVACAPGNAVRIQLTGQHRSVAAAMIWGTLSLGKALTGWVCETKLFSATVLLLTLPPAFRVRPAWLARSRIRWEWLLPTMWLGFVAIAFYMSSWAKGGLLPHRTFNALYFLFLLGWFLTVVIVASRLSAKVTLGPGELKLCTRCACAVLVVCLICSGNTADAAYDLVFRVRPYDRAFKAREQYIQDAVARGQDAIWVEPILNVPRSYCYNEIKDGEPQEVPPGDFDGYGDFGLSRIYGAKKTIRCRPLTTEEYERMMDSVPYRYLLAN